MFSMASNPFFSAVLASYHSVISSSVTIGNYLPASCPSALQRCTGKYCRNLHFTSSYILGRITFYFTKTDLSGAFPNPFPSAVVCSCPSVFFARQITKTTANFTLLNAVLYFRVCRCICGQLWLRWYSLRFYTDVYSLPYTSLCRSGMLCTQRLHSCLLQFVLWLYFLHEFQGWKNQWFLNNVFFLFLWFLMVL